MDIWVLFLIAGAAGRLTRLLTGDQITSGLRAWIEGRNRAEPEAPLSAPRMWAAYWVNCDWCSGLPIAMLVSVSWWAWGHCAWWEIAAAALTANLLYAAATQLAQGVSTVSRHAITALRPPSRGR